MLDAGLLLKFRGLCLMVTTRELNLYSEEDDDIDHYEFHRTRMQNMLQ